MTVDRGRRKAMWVLVTLCSILLIQFGLLPAYDHWRSVEHDASLKRCPTDTASDPRKHPRPDGQIKTIRLTDQGTFVDRCELVDALYELHWDRSPEGPHDVVAPKVSGAQSAPKLVVVFVHGWLNDERQTDGNYVDFKKLIERLRKEVGTAQQVTGIYLTWSARSDIPIYQYLTFWNRMGAADRISQSAIVTSIIGAINHSLDQTPYPSNQLVLIGHSFGARILQAATSQSMLFALQQARPRTSEGRYKIVSGVADAVILLNPAFEATMFGSIDDVRYDGGAFAPEQHPLMVTIATTNDQATKYAFPVGQWLAHRASDPEMTTVGNYSDYATHALRRSDTLATCDTELNLASLTQGFFAAGLCLERLKVRAKGRITAPYDPFLVVRTTPDIIDNHSGIWGDTFSDWLFGFIAEIAHRRQVTKRGG